MVRVSGVPRLWSEADLPRSTNYTYWGATMNEIVRSFGPWGLFLFAMFWLLKVMVADKLRTISHTLDQLVADQKSHNDRIVRIETIMHLNHCGDGDPSCQKTFSGK